MSLAVRGLSAITRKMTSPPLTYKVIAECPTTKARVGCMTLRHGDVDTPVFMPVGTQVSGTTCSGANASPRSHLKVLNIEIIVIVWPVGNTEGTAAGSIVRFKLSNHFGKHLSFGNASGKLFDHIVIYHRLMAAESIAGLRDAEQNRWAS